MGWAALRELPAPADEPTLELLEVDAAVSRLQSIAGKGSQAARREELAALFSRATEPEQRLLDRPVPRRASAGSARGRDDGRSREGGRRTGCGRAPRGDARRRSSFGRARSRCAKGGDGLARFRLTPLRPIGPMLAQTAGDVATGLERLASTYVEWKLDGARIQAHRVGDDVAIFTRNLADITERVPEIVAAVRALDVSAIVLDGEAIALREDGRPQPFQVTMSRFGTKAVAADARPLTSFFFDCLHVDGDDLIDLPGARAARRARRATSDGARRSAPRDERRRRTRRRSSTTRSREATRASWSSRSTRRTRRGAAEPAG